MRFNCCHTFTLEAESREEFEAKLAHYGELLRKASGRLDIGYEHGFVAGQPAGGINQRAIADEKELETLFDG